MAKRLLGVLTDNGWAAWETFDRQHSAPVQNKHRLAEEMQLEYLVRNTSTCAILTVPVGAEVMQSSKTVQPTTRRRATLKGATSVTVAIITWSGFTATIDSNRKLYLLGENGPITMVAQ